VRAARHSGLSPGARLQQRAAPGARMGRRLLRRRPRGGRPRRQFAQESGGRSFEPSLRPDRSRSRVQVPPAMKLHRRMPRGLGAKLFISHFLVALVGALTLLTAILVIVPVVFGNLASGTGEVVGSVAQVFGRTLLYSLLFAGLAAAVAAAVTSLFVSRRIVDPLWHMLNAT